MRRIYLSHSFQDRDRVLVGHLDNLIRSHGLIPINSRVAGGGPLTDAIKADIEEADGLVALFTRRESDPHNVTHPWVTAEHAHARFQGMHAVAVYEEGVPPQGPGDGYEYVAYSHDDEVTAIVRLSAIIGLWRRRAGRQLKVQIVPEEVAREIGRTADQCVCEYRWHADGAHTEWQRASIVREAGGVFAYLRLPEEAPMVQIRTSGPAGQARSVYTPLWLPVTLDAS